MIKKLLIANRGDVCRRIVRTAHRLGIAVVVVQEGTSPPQYLASYVGVEFVVQPMPDQQRLSCYLDGDYWIELARQYSCDAVHPGWGFLAEDHRFAQRCLEAGLIWVGPSPTTMRAMASKVAAKLVAERCGVPTIAGSAAPLDYPQGYRELTKTAERVGYPLVVKAVAGGGGRSLQVVYKSADLESALARSAREGKNYFGDSRLLIEAYYSQARHIEIQIVRDHRGDFVSLGSRDGSVQRRYQKFLEESPALPLTQSLESSHQALMQQLDEYSRQLAQACDYHGVGTIEFLVIGAQPGNSGQHWESAAAHTSPTVQDNQVVFLEMNTRLQVEHPVTEQVWAVDLVEWQLKLAARLPLSVFMNPPGGGLRRHAVHSVQARICAEDPHKTFRPSEGAVLFMMPRAHLFNQLPDQVEAHLRYEVAIEAGSMISTQFDSLMGKVIATAPSRAQALRALRQAVSELIYVGPQSNQEFILTLLEDEELSQGPVHCQFVDDRLPHLLAKVQQNMAPARALLPRVTQELVAWLSTRVKGGQGFCSKANEFGQLNVRQKIAEVFSQNSKVKTEQSQLMAVLKPQFDYQGRQQMVAVDSLSYLDYGVITRSSWVEHFAVDQTDCSDLDFVLVLSVADACHVVVRTRQGGLAHQELKVEESENDILASADVDSHELGEVSTVSAVSSTTQRGAGGRVDDGCLQIISPLSGRIVSGVFEDNSVNQHFTADTSCVTIEAMKMESGVSVAEFLADAGHNSSRWTIDELYCAVGDMVQKGDLLMVLRLVDS